MLYRSNNLPHSDGHKRIGNVTGGVPIPTTSSTHRQTIESVMVVNTRVASFLTFNLYGFLGDPNTLRLDRRCKTT